MAHIKAFEALSADQKWFNCLLEQLQGGHSELKQILEGRGEQGIGTGEVYNVDQSVLNLLKTERYHQQQADAIYIYEQTSAIGKQYGIWVMTAVQDFVEGTMIKHEQTLIERELRLADYRTAVGLEGSPVLLTYPSNPSVNEIINTVVSEAEAWQYQEGNRTHRLWKVENDQLINRLVGHFSAISKVYVGDGHHRLAAAARMQNQPPQWVMALYVSTEQLHISAFTRLVLPEQDFDEALFMQALHKLFTISNLPAEETYIPDQLHRFGLYISGQWYQLDLKPEYYSMPHLADVVILQERLLAPVLGIIDPQSDPRLVCDPLDAIAQTLQLAQQTEHAILFVLHPMKVDHLIEHADQGFSLPPKSSFIEPKVPYGLLLNAETVLKRARVKV